MDHFLLTFVVVAIISTSTHVYGEGHCRGDATTWTAGYGTCDTYAGFNNDWCAVDCKDGLCAYQVCIECEKCTKAPTTTAPAAAPTTTAPAAVTCETVSDCQAPYISCINGYCSTNNYYLSRDKTLCSDQGATTISSATECRSAMYKIPEATDFQFLTEINGEAPRGCVVTKGYVYWNDHATGSSHNYGRQVCTSIPECKTDEFKCNNHKCISNDLTCDEEDDCGDGSDEYLCGCSVDGRLKCPHGHNCVNGQCKKIPCVPDETELSQRWWPDSINADCAQMQKEWKVCTNEEDNNHKEVMKKCPATCALAREECTNECNPPCPAGETCLWGESTCYVPCFTDHDCKNTNGTCDGDFCF